MVSYGLARAATGRAAMCLSGTGAIGALFLDSWLVFATAIAGYLGCVAVDLVRPRFWRAVSDALEVEGPRLPDPGAFGTVTARRLLERLIASRVERAVVLDRTPAHDARTVRGDSAALERSALRAIHQIDELGTYLVSKSVPVLRADRLRVAHAAALAVSQAARHEYVRAHAIIEADLAAVDDVAAQRDVIVARVERILGVLRLAPSALVARHFCGA